MSKLKYVIEWGRFVMKKVSVILILCFLFSTMSVFAEDKAKEDTGQLIIVNKTTNKLAFYDNHQLVGIFNVATGRQADFTPVGTFSIIFKVKNPWYKGIIPGGSKENPLGYRWMGLDARGTGGGKYGIHGNNNENSIGTYASAGCVRMHNDENIWLYDRVKMYTKVIILNSNKSFDTIAKENKYTLDLPETDKVATKVTTNFKTYLYDSSETGQQLYTPTFKTVGKDTVLDAFEQRGNWYHVHTSQGDKWISNATAVEGEQSKTKTTITLSKDTPLYLSPNTSVVQETQPAGTVESVEQIGEWYRIQTEKGDRWLYQKNEQLVYEKAILMLLPAFVR